VRLFAIPAFAAAVGAMFVMFAALFAMVYLAYQWQSYVLGFNTLESGLGLAPLAVLMLPLAILGTRIAGRIGLRRTMTLAMLAGALGAALYAWAGMTEAYWTLGLGCLAFGACIGLSAGPGTVAISSPLPASRQGVASAVNDLARELGATLGIAVAGTAFNIAYRRGVRADLDVTSDPIAAAVLSAPGAGERAIATAHVPTAAYQDTLVSASNAGWTLGAAAVAVFLLLGTAVFAVAYPRSPSRPGPG
jgi:MFS family permease